MSEPVLAPLLDASLDEASAVLLDNGTLTAPEPARAALLAAAARAGERPILAVTATGRDAERLHRELTAWTSDAVHFASWETLPHERLSPRPETVARRVEALRAMRMGKARVMVAPVLATLQPMVPGVENIEPITLSVGDSMDVEALIRNLVALDYRRTDLVERRGEFAVRGGIVDVFAPTVEHPVRLEFFGDEIESVRTFAVASQRTIEHIERVEVYPCRELLPTDEVRGRALAAVKNAPTERLELARLADGTTFEGVEALLELLYDETPILRELLPKDVLVVLIEPKRTLDRANDLLREVDELRSAAWQAASDGGRAPASGGLSEVDRAFGERTAALSSFRAENPVFEASMWDVQRGDVAKMAAAAADLLKQGYRVVACATSVGAAQRVGEVLEQFGVAAPVTQTETPEAGAATVVVAGLEEGFWSPAMRLAVIGEHDLFGKRRAHREPKTGRKSITPLDLKPGDYVVHAVHGVGRYARMETRTIGDSVNDYIVLDFADGDKLFVPADQLDAVSKYIGAESPKLSRLGSSDFARQKAKVRKAVRDMADELIALYSKRASAEGHAFSADQAWQRELEDAFPYVETKDQLSAIDDVKSDMERILPMDRLICGDVGFGKTEIAIRAAFKAVLDGKQVAILVPTTLLAQQHYATFTERFAPFPARVGLLSRFVTPTEQKQTLDELAAHKIDVVIGTHRLLQKDVVFADLGLMVIDEEQRFGVAHKEKLKALKTNVDALTMTATPIPRTLEMAMGGLRDMSVIDTPPEDRHPILTFVGAEDDETITRAIRREMLRDGQTFFVHNTVQDIERAANRINTLVPDAKIGIAHGQMNEKQLEKVMLDFWDREYDVLLATTIIESGLDIPNANTLIVDRADKLGLAQLYQLRGRVGRSRERAYAYFLYPQDRSLSEQSHARLSAIGTHTDLGSGLQIALRDLEIRGAGNLLGGEQSGHISSVGFDLYVKMLNEAVAEAKGKKPLPKPEVKIDLPVDAHLPEGWIPREGLRLEAYRRIAESGTDVELDDVRAELIDRYGPLPDQAEELLNIARVRFRVGPRAVKVVNFFNGMIRMEPFVLAEYEKVRLARLFKGAIFKPNTYTIMLPAPASPKEGIAKWLLNALDELLADD